MFLSLLYPTEESAARHARKEGLPHMDERVCEELGLPALLPLRGSSLPAFFTKEEAVMAYRQEIFADMQRVPALCDVLSDAIPVLFDILELRQMDDDLGSGSESYLYSITEIELYVSCVDSLAKGLLPLAGEVKSRGFSALCDRIRELSESEYYRELNRGLSALSSRIREVKSITIGVNLDARLRPAEAGVISVNSEPFKSGKVLDKILRMSFKNDSFTCIADLLPYDKHQPENRKEAMSQALYNALGDVFRSSVRSWRKVVSQYVLENTDFLLKILPELEFVTCAAALHEALAGRGYPLCRPTLCAMEEKAFRATGLYNANVAVRIEEKVVPNDFCFDEEGRIFILTGPNRGGKSVITCAVGQAQALSQLGLFAPAESLSLSPVDGIFTHFPEGSGDTIDKGRLGEECARLRDIFDGVTAHSLVLLDESLSSTGAYEASYIAAEVICGFGALGLRGIFSTHLHELAAGVGEINARIAAHGGVKVDTLVAGMEEGERSFRIQRRRPDGKSYARDIADKYGLSFETLCPKA